MTNSQKLYASRKAAGLCTHCGQPNDNSPFLYCKSCTKQRSEQAAARKEYYDQRGRCNICGGERMLNSKFCYRCWETNYDSKQRRRERRTDEQKEQDRIKENAANRKRKQKALESGICFYCLKRPAIEGRRECVECLIKIRKRSEGKSIERKAERDNLREYRISHGLCTKCGEPAKEGYKCCERHYQVACEASKSAHRSGRNNDLFIHGR